MSPLAVYIRDVEPAQTLAKRVQCHHTTIYRLALRRHAPNRKLARRIEDATGGKVPASSLFALPEEQPIGEVGAAEPGQEVAKVDHRVHGRGVARRGNRVDAESQELSE